MGSCRFLRWHIRPDSVHSSDWGRATVVLAVRESRRLCPTIPWNNRKCGTQKGCVSTRFNLRHGSRPSSKLLPNRCAVCAFPGDVVDDLPRGWHSPQKLPRITPSRPVPFESESVILHESSSDAGLLEILLKWYSMRCSMCIGTLDK